jgi:hypothetical protein
MVASLVVVLRIEEQPATAAAQLLVVQLAVAQPRELAAVLVPWVAQVKVLVVHQERRPLSVDLVADRVMGLLA